LAYTKGFGWLLTDAQEGAGFIADEEEEDEEDARRERRRRKKRKNREAEEVLDDDDLDLIGIDRPEREDESQV
jgi:transcription elongation factor SPT6